MRATKQARIFGYPEDPGVQEKLPLILEGADRKCQASIDIEGPATLATWYELWEAVTAVASMCVRQKGKGGKAKNLGIGKNIRLELLESKQEPGKLGNISTVSLPEAGVAVQDFDAESSRGGMTAFDGDVPFELLMGVVQHTYDNSSLVTLPGRNDSVMGS